MFVPATLSPATAGKPRGRVTALAMMATIMQAVLGMVEIVVAAITNTIIAPCVLAWTASLRIPVLEVARAQLLGGRVMAIAMTTTTTVAVVGMAVTAVVAKITTNTVQTAIA